MEAVPMTAGALPEAIRVNAIVPLAIILVIVLLMAIPRSVPNQLLVRPVSLSKLDLQKLKAKMLQ
jgi:hypothetical protein